MKEVYRLSDAIQWHEGMLLSPQHFQQMALRQEQLLHYHLLLSTPFPWGVRYLKIDPVLLLNGRLTVLDLEGIMPDGLLVWHGAGEEEALELDLESYLDELKQQDITVHLVVPAHREGGNAFQGDLARYRSLEGRSVVDENTGEGEIRIPRLRPRLGLLVADDVPAKYTGFPLARITYKNETFSLTDFVTPSLNVIPQTPLYEECMLIASRAREKASFLSERLRMPSYSSRLDKPMLFETQMIIQGLVVGLPQLEAFLYAGRGHPYNLYMLLCGFAGSLAGYSGAVLPPVFPAYNHNDLRATFTPLQEFIHKILDSIHESYVAVPFQWEQDRFILLPNESWLDRYFVIGVKGRQGVSEQELITWVREALIGSSSHIRSMREKRVLGANRQRIDKDENMDLIPTKGILLFRVDVDPGFIEKNQTLEILNTSSGHSRFRPAEIIFYARNVEERIEQA